MSLRGRSLTSLEEISKEEVDSLLDLAAALKRDGHGRPLTGRSAALVFLNPSLRTRTSFELAMARLGGHAVILSPGSDAWRMEAEDGVVMDGAAAEHVREAAGVLGAMADLVGVRSFPKMEDFAEDSREIHLRSFARHAGVPVVNMESALAHPLQALADLLTLRERLGDLRGRRLHLTWAYHPRALPIAVPRSALLAACRAGMEVTLARPEGMELPDETMSSAERYASGSGGALHVTTDPDEGYEGANAVYAKSWASPAFYGRLEEEAPIREAARGWRVTEERMALGADDAFFLHCLPVRRNVVVSDAVLDGPSSAVIGQAENRLWTTMAVALSVLGEEAR
jgi:N-acetylornithine carbamoyltransferase